MLRVLLFVDGIAASGLPQAGYGENLQSIFDLTDLRYSNDIKEDACLNASQLIKKYGYPVEVHHVITEDGYILEMHRISHGRDKNNMPGDKPVVFVMHGLLCSSADWVTMGPGNGLAYILAEEGFDVWMGNARGNTYSRRHKYLDPDSILNTNFWKFTWDEIGNFDLPAMIDYILQKTNQPSLHYIGHSQGTTSFFVLGSLRPAYNDKIISMHALAPVAYMAHNRNPLLLFIAPFASKIESVARKFGLGEFLPNSPILAWAGEAMCRDEVVFQPLCSHILFLIGGWNEQQHNATMMPVIFGHTPAGASVRQLAHYGQSIADQGFRRYDYGSLIANILAYGSILPPRYDLSKVTTSVFLHYSESDPLAATRDVDTLWKELGRPSGKFLIPMKSFSHLDFMWGIDAKSLVYDRVIKLIWAMDPHGIQPIKAVKSPRIQSSNSWKPFLPGSSG